jgi:phosphoserine phosphatase
MLELAYAHQDAGRPVYICTAASQEMAGALSYILGFDGAIGSRSEIRDGVYTGREGGLFAYREEKARAVIELAGAEGIELSTSYAYSDSESDLPMLRAVGNPVAVNPDAALARVARDAGWEVLRFDRLGRRLKIGAALAAAAAGGLGGSALRRTPPTPPPGAGRRGSQPPPRGAARRGSPGRGVRRPSAR